MMKNSVLFSSVLAALALGLLSAFLVPTLASEEDGDAMLFGLELEKLLGLVNGFLALALFFVTFASFRRENRERLLYVSLAFLMFAARNFLVSSELFVEELPFLGPASTVLDFAVMLAFFYGILKR